MVERMGAFMGSKGFDVLPLAQQQELAQTFVDLIQGIPGSGQSQRISPQDEQTIRQRFAAATDDATREAMRQEAKERFGITL
jgi:hypothetical protein